MNKPPKIAAGEAFVASFSDMTRSMAGQTRALARKVSLAQLLDVNHSDNSSDNKENSTIAAANHALPSHGNGSRGVYGNTGNAHGKVLEDLRSLDSIVSDLERRTAVMRDAIESHRRGNAAIQEMSETARQRTAQLAAVCASLPEHLPHAAPPVAGKESTGAPAIASTVSASHTPADCINRRAHSAAASGLDATGAGEGQASRVAASTLPSVPVLELVTVAELDAVPRSTRARLTIAQMNAAVMEIQKAVERRHAFLSKPRKKLSEKQRRRLDELKQQEVPAHEGEPFIAEADLRALPAFKKGEVTAKALIATLRNLKRLKGVRGAGMMTYVVCGG